MAAVITVTAPYTIFAIARPGARRGADSPRTTYASVPANWYFSQEDSKAPDGWCYLGCGLKPNLGGPRRVITKHLGTMAFGSLVITIVQLIRMALEFIDNRTKRMQEGNRLLWLIMKCFQCCLWCLHATLKYIIHHSYIYVAVKGSGFCWSCFRVFGLIGNAGGQLAINRMVGSILALVISLTIPAACGVLAFYWIEQTLPTVNATWPTVTVALCALVIANGIAEVFRCVIDTIFVCAHMDMQQNGDNPKYMSETLRTAFELEKGDYSEYDKKAGDSKPAPATPTQSL